MTISDFLAILFLLMVMQGIGTYFQVRQYRRTVSKLHKLGNLGVGSNRRKFGAGSIVIIACSADGTITGAEEMRGLTIFNGFKEIPDVVGKNIGALKVEYEALPDNRRKFYKAHLQAIEALENRLKGGEKS